MLTLVRPTFLYFLGFLASKPERVSTQLHGCLCKKHVLQGPPVSPSLHLIFDLRQDRQALITLPAYYGTCGWHVRPTLEQVSQVAFVAVIPTHLTFHPWQVEQEIFLLCRVERTSVSMLYQSA